MRRINVGAGVRLLVVTTSSFMIGCGSTTGSTGELGRVTYTLHSDYESEVDGFDEAVLVTGHTQNIWTDLTEKGVKNADGQEGAIEHSVDSSDVVLDADKTDDASDEVPDFELTALEEGTITITSTLRGSEFDYIDMTFGRPDAIEAITWLLRPDAEDWEQEEGTGPHTVDVGTQVTFLPVPRKDGERLVGDVDVDLSVDQDDMVAQGENVLAVYEQRVIASSQPVTLFFIEAGDVQIQLTDTPNNVYVGVDFTVQ